MDGRVITRSGARDQEPWQRHKDAAPARRREPRQRERVLLLEGVAAGLGVGHCGLELVASLT